VYLKLFGKGNFIWRIENSVYLKLFGEGNSIWRGVTI